MGPYWLYDNHYLTDKYIINPAFAGYQYFPKVFAGTQRMDMQLPNAPAIHLAGVHSRVGIKRNYSHKYQSEDRSARNAIGALLFADNNGPFQSIGVKLDYVYNVPLNRDNTTLSFGLGGMLLSKRVRLDKYYPEAVDDPLVTATTGNHVMVPDVNVGVLLSHRQLYVGFSVSQLLENSYNFSKFNYTPASVFRNYYLMAGYRIIYSGFELEPSLVAGHNLAPESRNNNGNFVDVNLESYLKPVVFTVSYRISGFFTAALLYRVEKFEMGVRMELFSTNKTDAFISSFGLMMSYTFSK